MADSLSNDILPPTGCAEFSSFGSLALDLAFVHGYFVPIIILSAHEGSPATKVEQDRINKIL
jgi:hypothetical protein